KSSYFDAKLRKSVKYILDYADKYKAVPTFEQVQAETNVALQKIEGLNERHTTAFLDEIELFCRHKAMEEVIYAGPDLLAKGQHSDIEKMAKEAVLISLQRELGTNYFEDPRGRLERMRAKNGMMST